MQDKKTDRTTFAGIMAYIGLAVQKSLTDAAVEVYYDLLGHWPADVLNIAAKRAVLEHKYATFPPVAILADFAADAARGEVKIMTGAEAWGIAREAIGQCDIEVPHTVERLWNGVPPAVVAAVRAFGFMAMYNLPSDAIETARAQFIKIFDSIADRERRTGILPPSMQEDLAAIGEQRPRSIDRAIAAIGVEKP